MVDTRKIISIITGVFVIFIVMKITEFLQSLPQCPCYTEKMGNTHNLDKLVFLEKSVIFIALAKIAHTVYTMFMDSGSAPNKEMAQNSPYILLMLLLTVSVYTFFTYNVYKHQQSAGSKCECADKWQQNVMYFQALVYALVVAMVLILGLALLSSGTFGDSNIKRVATLLAAFIVGLGVFTAFGGDMNVFLEKAMMEGYDDMGLEPRGDGFRNFMRGSNYGARGGQQINAASKKSSLPSMFAPPPNLVSNNPQLQKILSARTR